MQKILEHSSQRTRIIYLFLFSLMGSFVASGILFMAGTSLPSFENSIWYYRLSIVLQDIFVVFLPAYTICRWITDNPLKMIGLKKSGKLPQGLFYGLLIFLISYPAIAVIGRWNEQIVLPDSLKVIEDWMRQMEDAAKQVTDLFLSGETIPDLFLNLLIIAAAAAFVEEVFFRGVLQQFIEKWLHNGHAAVWVGAFIFSAIHLQFYGFIPRLIMGAVLGYLFLYSRNLWIPILYHFVNNAAVVVITYFWDENNFLKQLEDKPLTWMSLVVMTASGLLTYFLFLRYKELFKKDDSN
ncbi:MAG: CPBP family intramembrane glutamic endopeptidase [Petrimonas sp.]|uniref:CPBP family intramembrane glutamic endopeptidase n=1 Tax=Petrimonas sp. TaxID=2023866 RepID=UPI002B3BD92F|nr:CPBP family intramembrane glutamic endopeptidase [Petrimonas sp.]MEA4950543.1 CPBP family intramembrane glutamic endopeptidase [Petrimonas sp.]MEA5043641.1 CPBP family intramembrane glutamic endopeptidase [Petrimonas sp.]MEA5063673.1 CPBP family intramembrane glutamic endopeptidase [Petrimonas sp.]